LFSNALPIHPPTTPTKFQVGDNMSDTKVKLKPEILAERPIEKLNGLELVITPKKEFLKWFKNTKGIMGNLDIKERDKGANWMECPNCKSRMDNYELNNQSEELWHLCSKCNLTFSKRQHKYFTTMIMRLINEKKSSK
jgi:hypothetical protein